MFAIRPFVAVLIVGELYRHSEFDRVVGRIHQVLLRTEISFGRLDRRMSKKQLDLLKFAASGPTQLSARPATMPHAA